MSFSYGLKISLCLVRQTYVERACWEVSPTSLTSLFQEWFKYLLGYSSDSHRTITTSYNALFLGNAERIIKVMNQSFPELGLKRKDVIETSWINSLLYIAGYPNGTTP
ncbi:hypothetical protein Lal_00011391 [Lupinus albus]|nr:hypothetical protein Lal_00011391 [Lupinus albus]